jgi:AraC family transcriptional regulator
VYHEQIVRSSRHSPNSRTVASAYGAVLRSRSVAGFDLMEVSYPAGARILAHEHGRAVFCVALDGACAERYGSKAREFRAWTFSYLPPGDTHSLDFRASALRAFSLDVPAAWLERLGECSLTLDHSIHARGGDLGFLFARLYEEFLRVDSASALAVEGIAAEMLAAASRSVSRASAPATAPWLERARDLLHARFDEPLALSDVAAAVGVHPVSLARSFRVRHGASVGEYLRHVRVEFARRELLSTDAPIAEIAAAAGFADQSHFGRTFKRLTGTTPAAFRSSARRG